MTKPTFASSWIVTMLIACVSIAPVFAVPAGHGESGDEPVKVTVKYTGKGDVDKTHRLWVWLFDTPDIGPGAIPVAELSHDENGGTITFAAVTSPQVWIAVAYDEKGGFAGSAPPPSGSPVTIYGLESGAPKAVTPGTEANVAITFDDSQRMP